MVKPLLYVKNVNPSTTVCVPSGLTDIFIDNYKLFIEINLQFNAMK